MQYKIANIWTIGALYKQRQGRYYQPILSASFNPTLQVYEPVYTSISEGERLPDYHLLDVSISKLQATTFGSMIIYASANNVFNFNNIRSYNYNQDYSEAIAERYGRRVVFFGAVLQW